MRITFQNMINIINTFNKYSNYKLPQKINFVITKNLINLEPHAQLYSRSLENIYNVFEPYVLKDDDGNILRYNSGLYQVDETHFNEYNDEIMQLLETEVEIELCYIDFSVFDYEDGDKYDILSPAEIMELKGILCKSEEENENG